MVESREVVRVFIKNQHLPKDIGWSQQLRSDAGKHSEDWGLEVLKETLNKRLVMPHKGNLTEIMCGEDVEWPYIYDAFTNADIIIVTFDKRGTKLGSARGFACLKIRTNKKGQAFFYIDLICNAPAARTRVAKAKGTYPTGTTMLAVIKALAEGKFKGEEKENAAVPQIHFIKLRALESVITYYSLFGWQFLGKDDNTACSRKKGQSSRISKKILGKLREVMARETSTESERQNALKAFSAYLDSFYKDHEISAKEFREEEDGMYPWTFAGTREARDYSKRADGYTMYKCLTGSRAALHNKLEQNRTGAYRLSLEQVGVHKDADVKIYWGRNLPPDLRPKNTDDQIFKIFKKATEAEEGGSSDVKESRQLPLAVPGQRPLPPTPPTKDDKRGGSRRKHRKTWKKTKKRRRRHKSRRRRKKRTRKRAPRKRHRRSRRKKKIT